MTTLHLLTAALGLSLVGLAITMIHHEWRGAEPPAGDRGRRARRVTGALLVAALGAGLVGWDLIDPQRDPFLFLNATAALLLLVVLLVMIGLLDLRALAAAARHRKLAILTKELYGISLKEMSGREAERAGREALKGLLHRSGGPPPGEGHGEQG